MANSTRDRFQAAISGAPTTTVAAGVVTAMHLANMRELFQELEEHINHQDEDSARALYRLKAEYTA